MAFCFKRRESVPKAISRLSRDRVEHALECLKNCARADAIHCARKDIKKVRAVLRLVRAEIPKKVFCRVTDLLRDAADQLAAPRDAYVKIRTLSKLTRHFKGQLARGGVRHVRAELRSACNEEMKRFATRKTVRSVERILRRAARKLDAIRV